jgi:ATP-dependent Clp protease protease subunit
MRTKNIRFAATLVAMAAASAPRGRVLFMADAGRTQKPDAKPWYTVKDEVDGAVEITIYERIGYDWWSGEGVEGKKFVEDLQKIPQGRPITLRINSHGGNVHDGMLIYNRLKERRAQLTVKVDGVAASIASVIALSGSKLEMPRNSLLMVHNPWAYAEGDAATMRQAADMLDKHRDAIMAVYEEKTGATKDQIKGWMDRETWMTGDEAHANKFCDHVTNEEISFQACTSDDLRRFRNVPEQLKGNPQQSRKTEDQMKKNQILARLRELGVENVDEGMEVAELQKLLTKAEAAEKIRAANIKNKNRQRQPANDIDDGEGAGDGEGEGDGEGAGDGEGDEPSAPSNRSRNHVQAVSVQDYNRLQKQLDGVNARFQAERKKTVEAAVRQCVNEDRLDANASDRWVKRILAAATEEDGDAILADLQAAAPRPPGSQSVGVVITGESPKDIERGILNMRQPLESWKKGNDVEGRILSANAMSIALAINDANNRKKLQHVLNTNTVDPALKRNVILQDFMRDFKRKLLRLGIFATTYSNIPLQGTNKMTIPFYELDTTTSKNFSNTTGYEFDHDTSTGKRELTVNKRKYKPMTFHSEEFRRQPYFKPSVNMALMAEQLSVDVWLDVLSILTRSNYGSPVTNIEAGAFDSDEMARLRKVANDEDWPDTGRSCCLTTDFELALLQDDAIKHLDKSGSNAALRTGSTGNLSGFDMFYTPRMPSNSEDLAGFICLPTAVLVGTAPIAPAPGVRNQLLAYDLVVDPDLGIALEYRYWGEAQMDKDREVVEMNYGYDKGHESALKLISNGANEYSSSSSVSSVNSSSSSSSSASF